MRRPLRHALIGTILLTSTAACGSAKGPSDAEVEKRIVTELQASGLTDAEATCYATAVVKAVGIEEVKDLQFDATEPSTATSKDLATAAKLALDTCNIDVSSLGKG